MGVNRKLTAIFKIRKWILKWHIIQSVKNYVFLLLALLL